MKPSEIVFATFFFFSFLQSRERCDFLSGSHFIPFSRERLFERNEDAFLQKCSRASLFQQQKSINVQQRKQIWGSNKTASRVFFMVPSPRSLLPLTQLPCIYDIFLCAKTFQKKTERAFRHGSPTIHGWHLHRLLRCLRQQQRVDDAAPLVGCCAARRKRCLGDDDGDEDRR